VRRPAAGRRCSGAPPSIYHEDKRGRSSGSGSLIHTGRRLVLTNYHVVAENDRVQVFFPDYHKDGDARLGPRHYVEERAKDLRVWGKVVPATPRLDLAAVELETVPATAVALPLARDPGPGRRGRVLDRRLRASSWATCPGRCGGGDAGRSPTPPRPHAFRFGTGQRVRPGSSRPISRYTRATAAGRRSTTAGCWWGRRVGRRPEEAQVKLDIDLARCGRSSAARSRT
jgi:hypothetical protein